MKTMSNICIVPLYLSSLPPPSSASLLIQPLKVQQMIVIRMPTIQG